MGSSASMAGTETIRRAWPIGGALLAPLAVVAAVAVTVGSGRPAPKPAPQIAESRQPAEDETAAFIHSFALSRVAPAREFVDEPAKPALAEKDVSKARTAAAPRPPAKRVEVAVLPPPRPVEVAPKPTQQPAPPPEPSFMRKHLGFDLPRLPDVASLAPNPVEVGHKAAELARRVGSSVAKIF